MYLLGLLSMTFPSNNHTFTKDGCINTHVDRSIVFYQNSSETLVVSVDNQTLVASGYLNVGFHMVW